MHKLQHFVAAVASSECIASEWQVEAALSQFVIGEAAAAVVESFHIEIQLYLQLVLREIEHGFAKSTAELIVWVEAYMIYVCLYAKYYAQAIKNKQEVFI